MPNPFALLGSDDEDGGQVVKAPAPKPAAAPAAKPAAAAAAAAPKKADGPKKAEGAKKSDAPKSAGPKKTEGKPRSDGDYAAEGDDRGNRARGNRGGRHATEAQKDRHSRSGKPKGERSKRDGAGHSNWGSDRDVIQDETEGKNAAPAAEPAEAAEGVEQATEEAAAPAEEDKTMSLDEYLAKKTKVGLALPKARAANEGADTKGFAAHQLTVAEEAAAAAAEEEKTKKAQRATQKVHVDVNIKVTTPSNNAGSDEGRGRGRGRGRGGRGGNRGGDSGRGRSAPRSAPAQGGEAPSFVLATDFPALGKN